MLRRNCIIRLCWTKPDTVPRGMQLSFKRYTSIRSTVSNHYSSN